MKSVYKSLVYFRDTAKGQGEPEMKEILSERVRHLYDFESRTPMLDDYLAPESVDESGEIVFGAENPQQIIRCAEMMEKANKDDAWETVSKHLQSVQAKDLEQHQCYELAAAFTGLAGTVTTETYLLLIDEFDVLASWPNAVQMLDIQTHPEKWVLCEIGFRVAEE